MKHGSWQRFARGRTRGVTLHAARTTDVSVIVNNNLEPRQIFSSTSARNDHKASQGRTGRERSTRSKMEIYSNASTARINFRLSFARPPTNLPLHDRDLARPPPKCPPLLRIFALLSANDLQRRWQGLPPIRIVPTSRSSLSFFLFILFYSSSLGAFYSRPASTQVILLRQKPAWILCTVFHVYERFV